MQKSIQTLIKELPNALDNRADAKNREWFTNYLKGVIEYRSVKTPLISGAVKQWVDHNGILELPLNEKLDIAYALLAEKVAEEKFACAIFIQKYLIKYAPAMELVSRTQSAFESGIGRPTIGTVFVYSVHW